MTRESEAAGGPGALRRGLRILLHLQRSTRPLGPAEIARAVEMTRPTVYRLLDILEGEGFVRRDESGKAFLASAPEVDVGSEWALFIRRMKPIMERIAVQTGNAVFLSRRDHRSLICLHREIGSHPVQILSLQIGGRSPLGVGAGGIAMLGALSLRERDEVMAANAAEYLEWGNLHVSTIRKLIENCRARGYSVVGNYALQGVLAVGIAIAGNARRPVTALSVTAPHDRLPLQRQREVAALMRGELAAAGIERTSSGRAR
ncbi:IclR family transcriptional regulator [Achromobacter aloeverae]|uniref:IclR family transcriptional regulator n=1 Tax=Achromobacter aloeverae TaxID=1750518 RepID=UPI0018649337|nr:helix-turn-helix domain-containing protein [Achromobacter aloeverae]